MNTSLTKKMMDKIISSLNDILNEQDNIKLLAKQISKRIQGTGRIIFIGVGLSPEITRSILNELWFNFQIEDKKFLVITAAKEYINDVENWKYLEDFSPASVFELQEKNITSSDLVIGLSSSGNSNYVVTALKFAKDVGCMTSVITNTKKFSKLENIDLIINTNFSEPTISGLYSAEGGVIQQIILNLILYNSMLISGRIYKNSLVFMMPITNKISEFCINIIMNILNVDYVKANSLFIQNNFSLECTIISYEKNITYKEAKNMLKNNNNNFNKIFK